MALVFNAVILLMLDGAVFTLVSGVLCCEGDGKECVRCRTVEPRCSVLSALHHEARCQTDTGWKQRLLHYDDNL